MIFADTDQFNSPGHTKVIIHPLLIPVEVERHLWLELKGQIFSQYADPQELIRLLGNFHLLYWDLLACIIPGYHLRPRLGLILIHLEDDLQHSNIAWHSQTICSKVTSLSSSSSQGRQTARLLPRPH